MIGNAVPVELARRLAEVIIRDIKNYEPTKTRKIVSGQVHRFYPLNNHQSEKK
jgi:hypothetical protein